MEYNPYAAHYGTLNDRIKQIDQEEKRIRQEISWHKAFDADTANQSMLSAKRELRSLEGDLDFVRTELSQLTDKITILETEARPGIDPRYWFSSERSFKKTWLKHEKGRFDDLQDFQQTIENDIKAKQEIIAHRQADLERYRNFDRLEADATVIALGHQIERISGEREELVPAMEQLHKQLVEPLAELEILQFERNGPRSEIQEAEALDRQLSNAASSFERKNIHQICQDRFGDSKPSRVIRRLRSELESMDRNIEKLDKRLRSIAKRGAHVRKTLVIDGNNFCYEQSRFIGLSALKAASIKLSENHSVIIVFDASIRSALKTNDRTIASNFADAIKVHVVATKTYADETILDVAAEPGTYVISNDRYRDYPDKIVVKEQRLITFEILNGRALIHELNVNEAFNN